jgi:hypothetical protein
MSRQQSWLADKVDPRAERVAREERNEMVFDPLKGGWTMKNEPTPMQPASFPPHWDPADTTEAPSTKHYEAVHEGPFKLGMEYETDLGLAPAAWSVSSAMADPRPNGKAIFDARFIESPVGRARAGRSMVWDPQGTAHAGGTKKAENWDAGTYADATEQDFAGMAYEIDPQDGCQ